MPSRTINKPPTTATPGPKNFFGSAELIKAVKDRKAALKEASK